MTTSRTPATIAIDGPSGSGKSTVSRAVATRLGLAYLDTGAMYRALTWWCLEQGVDLDDPDSVAAAARELPLRMGTDPRSPSVHVDETAVDGPIRTTRISSVVSKVASVPAVRTELVARQRRIMQDAASHGAGVVAEGRDITTVVAPDADVRVLLLADEHARLARRAKELHGHSGEDAVAATRDQVSRRDRDDSTVSQFLRAAPGVVTVDTSTLDLEQSIEAVLKVVENG